MRRARKSRKPRTHVKPVVGTLVWIRRRNGSWWPGRIISTDELSSLHLTSQRSGTPVKLLGREDASVDWYNVEKSKRVKAFRCGEFDECIENAKALGGLSGRRREKYARREDAILDAIELEKKQLERMSCFSETCSPERKGKSTVKQERHDGGLNSITSESSFNPVHTGDAGITSFRSLHKQENINALRLNVDLEDEGTESMPRMKGLHDLGMISDCPNTKKYERNGMSNGSCEASLLTEACTRPSPGNGAASNSSKSFSPWTKKKLTLNRCCEEGGLKRRDRRKPLTQVLESMTKLTMPVVTDGKLEKCDGLVLLQPMVGGPREVSFQPSIECGPLPSVVTDAAFLQEAAISLKDELKSPTLNSSSLGPLRQETSTACLVSTLACPEPLVCTTVRSRVLSSMRSRDKDYSLMSSSLSSPVSNACTFVTSACTCHSHLEGHFCKAMRGVCKQSSCLACSDSFSRGCEKSLGSKNISGLDSCRRIDGMSLRNGMPPVHKAVLFSDSSDAALEKGVTLSFKSCARDKTDDLMGVDNFLSNESSQWQEQELLTSTNHQDVTQSLHRGIQTMANKIDEASNTSLAKPMRPPLNKYCTRCTCWQDGSYSVCKRPKVGSQSTCMGRADMVSCEETKLVLESLEHAEGQKTLGRRIGNGVMGQLAVTDKQEKLSVKKYSSSSLAQLQCDIDTEKLGSANYEAMKKTCLWGRKDDWISTSCRGSSANTLSYAQPSGNTVPVIENSEFGDGTSFVTSTTDMGKLQCKFCLGKATFQANRLFSMTEDASNPQETVRPIVALFSGVTGQDVVGYAVQIEVLDRIVSAGASVDLLQPVWRTARRTARQRVPRSCTDHSIQYSRYCSEQGEELKFQAKFVGVSKHKHRTCPQNGPSYPSSVRSGPRKRILSNKVRSRLDKESISKKLLRRACLSSKRTRVLSSIAEGQLGSQSFDVGANALSGVMQNDDPDARKVFVNTAITESELEKLGNSSELVPFKEISHALPLFAPVSQKVPTCIPVTVAFSRLKAVVCD